MPKNENLNHSGELESARQFFEAFNQNDIAAALAYLDPQIERIEQPPDFPVEGYYRGHAEVGAHMTRGRETWAEGSCAPEDFVACDDKIVVLVHVRVRLKNKIDWIDDRIADVLTFRDGKIIDWRTFIKRQRALDWAGCKTWDNK